jgi:hypothetical protein
MTPLVTAISAVYIKTFTDPLLQGLPLVIENSWRGASFKAQGLCHLYLTSVTIAGVEMSTCGSITCKNPENSLLIAAPENGDGNVNHDGESY